MNEGLTYRFRTIFVSLAVIAVIAVALLALHVRLLHTNADYLTFVSTVSRKAQGRIAYLTAHRYDSREEALENVPMIDKKGVISAEGYDLVVGEPLNVFVVQVSEKKWIYMYESETVFFYLDELQHPQTANSALPTMIFDGEQWLFYYISMQTENAIFAVDTKGNVHSSVTDSNKQVIFFTDLAKEGDVVCFGTDQYILTDGLWMNLSFYDESRLEF